MIQKVLTKKQRTILLIAISALVSLILAAFTWLALKPVQFTYRDAVAINSQSYKTIILTIEKSGTIFRFNAVHFSFGLLQYGKPKTLPDFISIKETGSSPLLPPSGKNQVSYVEISVSGDIPGEYQIYLQSRIAGISLGRLPVTISIQEPDNAPGSQAADDLIPTPGGIYEYRANVTGIDSGLGPDGKPWPPIEEKTALLPFYREQ